MQLATLPVKAGGRGVCYMPPHCSFSQEFQKFCWIAKLFSSPGTAVCISPGRADKSPGATHSATSNAEESLIKSICPLLLYQGGHAADVETVDTQLRLQKSYTCIKPSATFVVVSWSDFRENLKAAMPRSRHTDTRGSWAAVDELGRFTEFVSMTCIALLRRPQLQLLRGRSAQNVKRCPKSHVF